jgi:O-antigen/teichoic acid export membrane protein
MYIFAPGLSIAKKMTLFATINIVGGLLNTTLNFTLIPFLGIFGAGWANLISSGIVFMLYMIFSQRYYFVPHAWKQLGLATLLSIGGVVIIFILLRLVERSHVWRIWQYMGRMLSFRVHSAS